MVTDNQPSTVEWAMLAMAVDCEGCVYIAKNKGEVKNRKSHIQYTLRLSVYNTNPLLIDWVQYWFGGSITKHRGGPTHKDALAIQFYGPSATEIIGGILPHLILKYAQAVLAIKFQNTIGTRGSKVNHRVLSKRETLYKAMQILNKTGK